MYSSITNDELKKAIRNIPDFPKPGIQFKDITSALQNAGFFSFIVNSIVDRYENKGITKVVAIESRGFIIGGAVASRLNAGFIPIRKPGKLPFTTYSVNYALEYGEDALEIHNDALNENDVVLLHDDLLATGGTSVAAINLIKMFHVKDILLSFIIELDKLKGKDRLGRYTKQSLIHF